MTALYLRDLNLQTQLYYAKQISEGRHGKRLKQALEKNKDIVIGSFVINKRFKEA